MLNKSLRYEPGVQERGQNLGSSPGQCDTLICLDCHKPRWFPRAQPRDRQAEVRVLNSCREEEWQGVVAREAGGKQGVCRTLEVERRKCF